MIHPEDRQNLIDAVKVHWSRREPYVTAAARVKHHQTGEWVWLRWVGIPSEDGGYHGWTERTAPGVEKPTRSRMKRIVSLAKQATRCVVFG